MTVVVYQPDEGLHARVVAWDERYSSGKHHGGNGAAGAAEVLPDWRGAEPLTQAEWSRLPAKVQQALANDEWGAWGDDRSAGVFGICHALYGQGLTDARVLGVLMRCPSTEAVGVDHRHAGDPHGWLWAHCALKAKPPTMREVFGISSPEGAVPGGRDDPQRSDATVGASPESTLSALDAALLGVEQLQTPYDDGVRELLGKVAEVGLDELATERVLLALQTRTDIKLTLLRRQLHTEVKQVKAERRAAAKAAPGSVVTDYVYVEGPGALWCLAEPQWVATTSFRTRWGEDVATAALEPEGGMSKCGKATYRPGHQWADGFDEAAVRWHRNATSGRLELNMWSPSPMVPLRGATDDDVRPWLDHLDKVVQVPPGPEREHVLDWLAYTVQHPGDKINHMLVLGGEQGTGKDTILAPLLAALGSENTLDVQGDSITEGFDNQKLAHCSFIKLQELSTGNYADAERVYNSLKNLIAAPPDTLEINIKNVKQFEIPNIVNVAAVTNSTTPLQAEQGDRRLFMVWCRGRQEHIPDLTYFDRLYGWYAAGGNEAITGWLLARDVSAFKPKAKPPPTNWTERLKADSLPPVAEALSDLLDRGEGAAGWDVVRVSDLLPLVKMELLGQTQMNPTAKQVANGLARLGLASRRVNKSRTRLQRQVKATFYILDKVREHLWMEAPTESFWAHVEGE